MRSTTRFLCERPSWNQYLSYEAFDHGLLSLEEFVDILIGILYSRDSRHRLLHYSRIHLACTSHSEDIEGGTTLLDLYDVISQNNPRALIDTMRGAPMHIVRRDIETLLELVATTCPVVKNTRQESVMVMYNVKHARGMYRSIFNHILDGTYRQYRQRKSTSLLVDDDDCSHKLGAVSKFINTVRSDFPDDNDVVVKVIEHARHACGVSPHVVRCLARQVCTATDDAVKKDMVSQSPMDAVDMLTLGLFLDVPRPYLDDIADGIARCFDGAGMEMSLTFARYINKRKREDNNVDEEDGTSFQRPFAWFMKHRLFRSVEEAWEESVVAKDVTRRLFDKFM
jgi:hypothetical protein